MKKRLPGRPIIPSMTPSQQRVIDAIDALTTRNHQPPTMRELSEELEQGVAGVFKTVQRLERNGYLSRTAGKSRSLTILKAARESQLAGLISIPLLGMVAAGQPMLAPENELGELLVDSSTLGSGRHFALRVSGESMVDAGIDSGDVLIVRHQALAEHREIVVALVNGEATVKRLHHQDGDVILLPENKQFKPIHIQPEDQFRIVGKVVAVRRATARSKPG